MTHHSESQDQSEDRYVAAIDQGTTSSRCIIFDRAGRVVADAEATALGAACAVGYWAGVEELRANGQVGARWEPRMEAGKRDREHAQWQKAVERTFGWVDPESGS